MSARKAGGGVDWLLRILGGAAILWMVLLMVLAVAQRRLIYFPPPVDDDADAKAAAAGLVRWRGPDGEPWGWRDAQPLPTPRARLLVLHGNAGSALDRARYAAALRPRGIDVVLLEYPGYAGRSGMAGGATLTAAAVEAVDVLSTEGGPVWLLGESLGSGVAARVAATRPGSVKALLLVTPFADFGAVVRVHYPFVPPFLLRDRFRPDEDLAAFPGPIYLLAAGRDEVTTLGQAEALAKALPGRKRLVIQPRATHNGLDLSPGLAIWDEAVGFFTTPAVVPAAPAEPAEAP